MKYGAMRLIVSALGVAGATLFGSACGQGVESPNSAADTNQSTSDALMAIQNCQAQARGCFDGGANPSCDDALRSCLQNALPDAGPPSMHPADDRDGASAHDDVEVPDHDGADHVPSLPDAASPASPGPRAVEGGPPALTCVDALRACLASQTRPMDCADQARTCLTGGHDAGRP